MVEEIIKSCLVIVFRENGIVFGGGMLYEGREFEVVEEVVEGDGEKRSFLLIVFWEWV